MSRNSGFGAWLATLRPEQLHALLRRRPDAALAPEPRDLGELAGRLNQERSLAQAVPLLRRPALQVAEAVLALNGSTGRGGLLRLLGVPADTAAATRVDQALDELLGLGLVWPVGESVRMSGAWASVLPDPLGLGGSGLVLYQRLTVGQLARIGSGLGLGGLRHKREWVEVLTAAAADPVAVAHRLQQAPPAIGEIVRNTAWHGPRLGGVQFPDSTQQVAPGQTGLQLAVQGWLVPTEWGVGEMPRELALAVRGAAYHAPFDPEPPAPATAQVLPQRLQEGGRHAAGAAVEAVRRLLALLDRAPPATLRDGGIGVRELRRTAKQLGTDEAAVRLWLEIAAAAGLLVTTADAVLATTDAEGWLTADPAEALAALLLAWWRLPMVPSHQLDEAGKPLPALLRWYSHGDDARLRAGALDRLAALPTGRGLVDADDLAEQVAFQRPVLAGDPEARPRLRATLAEATLLGLACDSALTPLGRDLLAAVHAVDPPAALAAATAGVLPAHSHQATFLPDLTAVVTGPAAVELSRLLDDVADAESRDAASTWRFTAASVRRALDAGRTAEELLAELAAVSDNPLPQPLEYLVRDVARRHGQVQVFAVASCIQVADAALGAELVAHRGLAALRLRALADTVLAGSASITDTMAALRAAGYAPIRQDAHGGTVIERAPVRRADLRRVRPRYPVFAGAGPPDLVTLTIRLAGGRAPDPPA